MLARKKGFRTKDGCHRNVYAEVDVWAHNNRIRNQEFRERLGVPPLSAKMRENMLRWFRHV